MEAVPRGTIVLLRILLVEIDEMFHVKQLRIHIWNWD